MARYFRHTTNGLISHFGDQVVVFSDIARDYAPAAHIRAMRFKGSEQIGLHDKLADLAARRIRPQAIYSAWFNTLRTPTAQTFVVYDMIYELFPRYHSWTQVPLRNVGLERKHCLERSKVIIAISHSTARDITTIYPQIDAAKIVVIHLGVDPFFFEGQPGNPGADHKPYLLYVGFRTGHKNFMRALTAYGQSGLAHEFNLRVISAHNWNAQENECIRRYHLQNNVSLVQSASDLELQNYYARAVALVYPSEYEGFGLPIIEAMASGTLVVTSNSSCMPEVGGDVAFYFDPRNIESIAETLRHVTRLSSDERKQRIAQGMARAHMFTWERCQQKTVGVIEELLGHHEAKG